MRHFSSRGSSAGSALGDQQRSSRLQGGPARARRSDVESPQPFLAHRLRTQGHHSGCSAARSRCPSCTRPGTLCRVSRRARAVTASSRQAVDHPCPLRRNPDASRSCGARAIAACPYGMSEAGPRGSTGSAAPASRIEVRAWSVSRPGRNRHCRDRSANTAPPACGTCAHEQPPRPRLIGHLGEQPSAMDAAGGRCNTGTRLRSKPFEGSRGWGRGGVRTAKNGASPRVALLRASEVSPRRSRSRDTGATASTSLLILPGGRPAGAPEDVRDRNSRSENRRHRRCRLELRGR